MGRSRENTPKINEEGSFDILSYFIKKNAEALRSLGADSIFWCGEENSTISIIVTYHTVFLEQDEEFSNKIIASLENIFSPYLELSKFIVEKDSGQVSQKKLAFDQKLIRVAIKPIQATALPVGSKRLL